jgi:pimeloyl-ACP methyl ester carboxylesterase
VVIEAPVRDHCQFDFPKVLRTPGAKQAVLRAAIRALRSKTRRVSLVHFLPFRPGVRHNNRPMKDRIAVESSVKNVILVHGAWADGSSWSKVIPKLEAKGLHVTAVQLPLTSFDDDVATVKRAIALENGPAVVVGHSCGGAVITQAGADAKVERLVYVAAFAPDVGESAGSSRRGSSVAHEF